MLVDPDGVGRIFSEYNLPASYWEQVRRIDTPLFSSPAGDALKQGKIVVVDNVMQEPRLEPWHDLLAEFGIQSIVWTPLFSGADAFGVYILYNTGGREVSEEEINTFNQVGTIFSMAIVRSEYIDEIREKSKTLEKEIAEREKVEMELREVKNRAEAANRAKSQFLGNMSHEIRTPMNAILGFASILLEEEQDREKREALEIIHGAGKSLLDIIGDILDLSKIEADKLKLEKINFSFEKMMEQFERSFRSQAEEKHLQFNVSTDPRVPRSLYGDRYKIKKVIFNILKNAFKFTRRGYIAVRCSYDHDNHEATVSVSDTGIGIPQDKQAEIFDAFNQVDSSTTRHFGGSGLGLTIAGKLTVFLGGKIDLESEEGVGTTFYIKLPLKEN
jgi:signal transduction histidine kinase